ncbi:MAG: carboxylesterase family protein [Gemmatimonadota bacterium]
MRDRMLRVRVATALVLAVSAPCANLLAQVGTRSAPRVRTADGIVEGRLPSNGVNAFLGIPFAAPPVGTRRWQPPQPVTPWRTVRSADRFSYQCMQGRPFSDMVFRNAGTSEDCLYLNVWTPETATPGKRLPVLVYFFGGGFVAGDGSEPRYDGESMAKQGIVVVTLSYRLGIFGFLAHPELTAESANRSAGNYGLMDQTAALRWVRTNVAAFGGDPTRVTIAGESAGSMSVSAQMATPLAKGLFARAIGESGALFPSGAPMATRAQAEENGVRFAQAANAPTLAALRNLSAIEVMDLANRPGTPRFGANVDGWFFPEAPVSIYAAGRQSRVPLLAGWNSEEASWRGLTPQPPTPDSVAAVLTRVFGARAAEASRHFPAGTNAEALRSMTDLAGDRFIGYSTWKWLETHAATSGQPVYRYFYARPRPGATGAAHSAEIEYAMGNLAGNKVFAWTPEDQKVSTTMQQYFANFITTGDPNGAGLPVWPTGAPTPDGATTRMRIDVNSAAEPEPTARYRFLDQAFATSPR